MIHKNELKSLLDHDNDGQSGHYNSTKESEMLSLSGGGANRKVESDYHLQRFNRLLSPGMFISVICTMCTMPTNSTQSTNTERKDAFAKSGGARSKGSSSSITTTSFKDAMKDVDMDREKKELLRKIALKEKQDRVDHDHDQAVVHSPVSLKRGIIY